MREACLLASCCCCCCEESPEEGERELSELVFSELVWISDVDESVSPSLEVQARCREKKKARDDDESQGKTMAFCLDGYLYAQTASGGAAGCGLSTKEVLGKGACHGFTYRSYNAQKKDVTSQPGADRIEGHSSRAWVGC